MSNTPTTTATATAPTKPIAFSSLVLTGEKIVKTLTKPKFHAHEAVVVAEQGNGEYVVRKAYPPTHRTFTERAIAIIKLAGRHPCAITPHDATRHKDYSVNVQEEFSDGADLQRYLECIKKKLEHFKDLPVDGRAANKDYIEFRAHQVQFAKAVARQLIEYVFWLETVIVDAPHRNINPKTILLRRNGSVKMKYFNCFTEEIVKENPRHFWQNCAYASPECSQSVQGRVEAGYANDIWAIGAVLFSIITGESYLPEYARKDPYKDDAGQNPPTQVLVDSSRTQVFRGSSKHHDFDSHTAQFDLSSEATVFAKHEYTDIGDVGDATAMPLKASELMLTEQQNRAQSTKYVNFMKFVDEATLPQWFERCGDPALGYLIKMCLTRDTNSRPTAAKLLAFMYVAGTGMAQHDYDQPSITDQDLCKLIKIVVPGRAWSRVKNAENVEIGWSMVLPWSQTYDAWGTDMAQLSKGYESTEQRLIGEQLYGFLRQNLEGGGPYRMYQHMLLFSSHILHFPYPPTADFVHLRATFKRHHLSDVDLEGELNSLMKSETINHIAHVLNEESCVQNAERSKRNCAKEIDKAARTAIDRQRRRVISGRLSCSKIAMSRAMCFLQNGYMESNFSRVPNTAEQREMDDARILKEIAANAPAGPNPRTTVAEKQDTFDPEP